MRRVRSSLRRLVRGEDGTATVELVILLPLFVLAMANAIEASILMTRATLLDRGLDMAVRELRLNTGAPPGFDEFRASVCRHAGWLPDDAVVPVGDAAGRSGDGELPDQAKAPFDCLKSLQVELRRVSTATWAVMDDQARCVDRREEIAPLTEDDPEHYRPGAAKQLMMVRACLVIDPLAPNYGLGALLPKDASGGYRPDRRLGLRPGALALGLGLGGRDVTRGRGRLAAFGRSEGAGLSVEAVLVFPFLLWTLAAIHVFWDGYRADTALAQGDLHRGGPDLARGRLSRPALSRRHEGGCSTCWPAADRPGGAGRDGPAALRLSVVRNPTEAEDPDPDALRLECARVAGEGVASVTDVAEIRAHIPALAEGDRVVVLETLVPWSPLIDVGLPARRFQNVAVTRPRFGGRVC